MRIYRYIASQSNWQNSHHYKKSTQWSQQLMRRCEQSSKVFSAWIIKMWNCIHTTECSYFLHRSHLNSPNSSPKKKVAESNATWNTVDDVTFHFSAKLYHLLNSVLFVWFCNCALQTTRRSVIKLQKKMPKVGHFSINWLMLPRSLVTLATIKLKIGKFC